jgi:hypothetical protein
MAGVVWPVADELAPRVHLGARLSRERSEKQWCASSYVLTP